MNIFSKSKNKIKFYLNLFNVNNFLFKYEIKIFFLYIKFLFLIKFINIDEKKKLINSLFIIKNLFLSNINLSLEEEIIKFNGNLGNKICFKKNNFLNVIFKLILKEEIEKINILIIFIRKCIINLSEKYFNIPFLLNKKPIFPITIGYYLLSLDKIFKKNHINLLNCKKLCKNIFFDFNLIKKNNFNKIKLKMLKLNCYFNNNNIFNEKNHIIFFFNFCNVLLLNLSEICENLIIFIEKKFIKILNLFLFHNNILYKEINVLKFIKSKIGKIFSNYINILIMFSLKNNLNMYQEKEILFENIFTIKNLLNCFRIIFPIIKFNKKNIYLYLLKNYCFKNDIIEYLLSKKISFKNSYLIFKNCEKYCKLKKINFFNISLYELKKINIIFEKDLFYFISIENSIKKKNFYGFNNSIKIIKLIQNAKNFLNNIILKFND